jgi:two-component system KDP operon response regulator KdpE
MGESSLPAADGERWMAAGDLSVNVSDGTAVRCGAAVELSPTEGRLLALLARQRDAAIPTAILTETLWGVDNAATRAYLQLYVRYLRHKLEDDPKRPHRIRGKPARGYQLVGASTPAVPPLRGRGMRRAGLRQVQNAL